MDNATITLIVLAFVAFFFVTELLPLAVTAMAGAIAVSCEIAYPNGTVVKLKGQLSAGLLCSLFHLDK